MIPIVDLHPEAFVPEFYIAGLVCGIMLLIIMEVFRISGQLIVVFDLSADRSIIGSIVDFVKNIILGEGIGQKFKAGGIYLEPP